MRGCERIRQTAHWPAVEGAQGNTLRRLVPRETRDWDRSFRWRRSRTTVQWFLLCTGLNFETLAPNRDFLSLPEMVNDSRPKENKIIAQRGDKTSR